MCPGSELRVETPKGIPALVAILFALGLKFTHQIYDFVIEFDSKCDDVVGSRLFGVNSYEKDGSADVHQAHLI